MNNSGWKFRILNKIVCEKNEQNILDVKRTKRQGTKTNRYTYGMMMGVKECRVDVYNCMLEGSTKKEREKERHSLCVYIM